MADTMESEEAITTNKLPVKNEESATSTSNTDGRNEDASSPPPNCSICLGKLINTSFTDSCLHQFCFTCLLQWSRIKTECPLCKQTFKSIIHNVRSEEDYDQYHVPRELAQPPPPSQMISAIELAFNVGRGAPLERRRFSYRTTMLHDRLFEIRLNPGQDPLRNIPLLSRGERRSRRTNPIAYRRNIYRTGEWSNPVPDIYSRFRECNAEYFRRHPQEQDRLIPWINRELLTLLNANQPHIAYVSRVIMDTLVRYDIQSPQFHEAVHPYFNVHTAHFIHELLNYCRSSLNVSDYDAVVTYSPCNPVQVAGFSGGYWNRVQSPISSSTSSSTTSDDSDVRVVEQVDNANTESSRTNVEIPALPLTYSELYMPGPSTVSETFQVDSNNSNNNLDNNNIPGGRVATRSPCVLTILSSASSDSDECEVVGYVKPRHERTPEIIELVSSDDERIITTENTVESESPPKISTVIPINDENPCTSNANNERHNTRNNQKPKSNNLKSHDVITASLSSSETEVDSDSDSGSDFVLRPAQKRNRGRNAKRNVKKSDCKSPGKSLLKRNKDSTSGSIDGKRETKRRRNSNGISKRVGRNVTAIISSSSDEENNAVGDNSQHGEWHRLKVRKDLISDARRRNNSRSSSSSSDKSSSSSNSSTSTSSTSSSSATSNTTSTATNIFGSAASLNCQNSVNNHSNDDGIRKKSRFSRNDSRNKVKTDSNAFENDNSTNKKSTRPKLKSTVVKCQRPVNSTVLRKDVDKKEWYIDNNRQSRSRSRSRSSYESQRDTNSHNNSHRRRHHRRRRSNSDHSVDNYRQRRMASRIANEKLKNQSLYSTADSQNDDDNDDDEIDVGDNTQYNYERSNSQSSTISDKYANSSKNDKHNSKCKNNTKKKYSKESKNGISVFALLGEPLDVASTSTSNQKYSEYKNNACGKKRSNSNKLANKKNSKDSKQRRTSSSSKPKSRRNKRHRTQSFSSSSSSSQFSSSTQYSSSE